VRIRNIHNWNVTRVRLSRGEREERGSRRDENLDESDIDEEWNRNQWFVTWFARPT